MIKLPRNTFLMLADMDLDKFQSIQRRGQQPRWLPGDHEDADGHGYFAYEALLMIIANKIFECTALDRNEAKTLVEHDPNGPMRFVLEPGESQFVGVVSFMNSYELACGTYEEVLSGFEDLKKNWREEFNWGTIFDVSVEFKNLMDHLEDAGIKILRNA